MIKLLKRWKYAHFKKLIPHSKEEFDKFADDILDTYEFENNQTNHDLIYSITFRLDFKIVEILPSFYFETIHRLRINDMIHEYVKVIKDKEKAEGRPVDDVKMSLLKQSPGVVREV